jgi:plasmid stabilization system protein ParE
VKSRFHEAAERDLTSSFHYYNEATAGLGDQFVAEVRAAVQFLEEFPEGARIVAGNIRGKTLVRFPHTALYVVQQNEIVILAVAHQRQDFDAWIRIAQARRRLPNSA